jgi:8-oxo-dGTP pyrophosphatase MutT (NUDIX family)
MNSMQELIVSTLVTVDAPGYEDYAGRRSAFAMVIPFERGLRRIWMAHHSQRGTWELPSGKIEPGEEPAGAAERELQEEAGARVGKLHPVGILLTRLGHVLGQGHLYWGEVTDRADLPWDSEMDDVRSFSSDIVPAEEEMGPVTRWVVSWMADNLSAGTEEGVATWTWG